MPRLTTHLARIGLTSLIASFTLQAASLPNPATDENKAEKKTESRRKSA